MGTINAADYQLVPLTKLLVNGLGAVLICDGVGVGKTISAGHALTYLTGLCGRSGAVVCPPSLVDKWRFELREKFGFQVQVIDSTEALRQASDTWGVAGSNVRRIYVLPLSLLARTEMPPFGGPVVIDEIHNLRNPKTVTYASAVSLTHKAAFRIGLSATPINNSLADLAAELSILLRLPFDVAEVVVQDLWRDHRRHVLFPIMTRFSKEKLGIHFVRREISTHQIRLSEEYWREVARIVKGRRDRRLSSEVYRDEMTWLRLATSSPRSFEKSVGTLGTTDNSKIEAAKSMLAAHIGELVLVFCDFEETANELVAALPDRRTFLVTGNTPVASRSGTIDQFRRSENGCLIMTSVGAEGLDVQFCSTLLNFDLSWNPMVLEQRIGRIDRLGQLKEKIEIHNFVVEDSIDDRILGVLGRKLGLIAGSPLESRGLLGDRRSRAADDVYRDFLSDEALRAAAVAKAVELSESIIPNDYSLIGSIDVSYCVPTKLASSPRAGQLPWLRSGFESSSWLQSLKSDADELKATISTYV